MISYWIILFKISPIVPEAQTKLPFHKNPTYHGVLAHQDNTLLAERVSDLVHLLRADIVDGDDEDGAVLFEQALELVEVAGLVCSLAPHIFLFMKAGFFRARGILVSRLEVMVRKWC